MNFGLLGLRAEFRQASKIAAFFDLGLQLGEESVKVEGVTGVHQHLSEAGGYLGLGVSRQLPRKTDAFMRLRLYRNLISFNMGPGTRATMPAPNSHIWGNARRTDVMFGAGVQLGYLALAVEGGRSKINPQDDPFVASFDGPGSLSAAVSENALWTFGFTASLTIGPMPTRAD